MDFDTLNYSTLDHLEVYYNLGYYYVPHIWFYGFSYLMLSPLHKHSNLSTGGELY